MAVIDDLKAVAMVQVGSSAEYAVTSISSTDAPVGTEGVAGQSGRRITYTLGCAVHVADAAAAIAAETTLRAALAKRGDAVTLTRRGAAVGMPAAGAGTRPGYPKTKVSVGAVRPGGWLAFTLDAETVLDETTTTAGAYSVVSHAIETSITTDITGNIRTDVSGTLRVVDGQNARTMAESDILPAAKAAALLAVLNFNSDVKQGDDLAACSYKYTTSPPTQIEADFSGQTAFGEVTDRTRTDPQGRQVRTVSGRATGTAATLYAESKEPINPEFFAQGSEISLPSEPDGRVEFRYEGWQGFTPAADAAIQSNFGAAILFSFGESVREAPGTPGIGASVFFANDPLLTRGLQRPWVYIVSTSIEFRGTFDDARAGIGIVLWKALGAGGAAADAPNNLDSMQFSESNSGGINRLSVVRTYIFATQQEMPHPREVRP